MTVLKNGSRGVEVTNLQRRLKALGFDPKGVDGRFGENTREALVAFQISKGLPPDGKADDATLVALGVTISEVAPATSVATGTMPATAPAIPHHRLRRPWPINHRHFPQQLSASFRKCSPALQ